MVALALGFPPGPVQEMVYVRLVVMLVMVLVSLQAVPVLGHVEGPAMITALGPVTVHCVTLAEVQVRVLDSPERTCLGFAVMVAVPTGI